MLKDVAGIIINTMTEVLVLCNLQSSTIISNPVKHDASLLDAFVFTWLSEM
jgi:hypothetical protein